jgi:hypothetical protein
MKFWPLQAVWISVHLASQIMQPVAPVGGAVA